MTKAKDYQSFVDQYRNRPHYFKLAKEMMERHETRQKKHSIQKPTFER